VGNSREGGGGVSHRIRVWNRKKDGGEIGMGGKGLTLRRGRKQSGT